MYVVAKVKAANLYKVYTDEPNVNDRKFVAMFEAANEDELIAVIDMLDADANKIKLKVDKKEYDLEDADGKKIGKINDIPGENIDVKDVLKEAKDYANARKTAIANGE